MQFLITLALIVIGVLLFEFIIFAHEFGHFITAKKSGVQVNEFALGMGPKLFGFKKGETQYSLRLFPIGGYCAMEGEDAESDNPRAFTNAKIWKRMIIIVAGAFMNFVVGLLLMFVVLVQQPSFESTIISGFAPNAFTASSGLEVGDKIVGINGYPVWNIKDLQFAIQTMQCKSVDPDSLEVYKEDCANLPVRTFVELVNNDEKYYGAKLTDEEYSELYQILLKSAAPIQAATTKEEAYDAAKASIDLLYAYKDINKTEKYTYPEIEKRDERFRYTADVEVERNGEKLTLEGVQFYTEYKSEEAAKEKNTKETVVRYDFSVEPIEKNFGTVLGQTVSQTASLAKTVWQSIVMLVQGRFSFTDLSGPVGITKAVSMAASEGLKINFMSAVNNIIFIMALITVNLGVVNLLPFPALDGGRFVMLVIEAIIRRPLPRKFEYIINGVGLALLLIFIAVISVKDVWQLVTGTFPGM
ncbi:MAG: RIP metalloprotease RseP [Ruminococcus sp.]|nr:RIP metalloprotease RseP [Ruminococcus sp.]MEE0844135.1 RIP metalloprotease RseP [Ruminococcus sp.]